MKPEKPGVVVLCEDQKSWCVLYHFLKAHGIGARKILPKISPGSKGAADAFISRQFPKEVKAYRSKANHLNICLLVMIDADPGHNPGDREAMLRKSLQENGMDAIKRDERIAILVPKRNIETWMHLMTDHETDEQTNYKRLHDEKDCKCCGIGLKEIQEKFRGKTPPDPIPASLSEACQELERICRCG